MAQKGTCKHGEFDLMAGCPQCIAERRAAGITPAQDEMEDGLNAEGLTLVGAEEPVAETALALRPGEDVEAQDYYGQAVRLLEIAHAREITMTEDLKGANDDLALISKLSKAMKAKREGYLAPLRNQTQEINQTYNALMAPIINAEKVTKDKMLAFNNEQRRRRQEQEDINRKRMEAAQQEMNLKGEMTESVNLVEVVPEPAKSVSTEIGTSGMTDHWTYEVLDFALLPDAYKVADTAMLNTIAKRHHDTKPIPGVRFYNEPYIAVRTK